MIHVPMLVIIPVLKKKTLLFDSPSYIKIGFGIKYPTMFDMP